MEEVKLEIPKKILIVGAGNVGTSLYRALSPLYTAKVHLYGKLPWNQFASKYIQEEDYSNYLNTEIVNPVDSIFICVQDEKIKEVCKEIQMYPISDKNVFHTSGTKESSEIELLKNRGAHIAGFHPLQSFASKFSNPEKFEDIFWSYEGSEKAREYAGRIAENLKGNIIDLTAEQKVALHTAGVFAANYFVGLLSVAESILTNAGIGEFEKNKILHPLVQGVVDNYKSATADNILSGPLKRGDVKILRKHIEQLRKHKPTADLYVALAKVLMNNPKFNIRNSSKMADILDTYR